MSIKRGETVIETLYIGLQKRTTPLPGDAEPQGLVYNITKDHKEFYGAPYITLVAGTTYKFVIDTPGHPFYITTDANGGGVISKPSMSMIGAIDIEPESTGEKGNVGIEKGVLTWTPERAHAQMKLYYQCNYHKNMGNEVIVKLG